MWLFMVFVSSFSHRTMTMLWFPTESLNSTDHCLYLYYDHTSPLFSGIISLFSSLTNKLLHGPSHNLHSLPTNVCDPPFFQHLPHQDHCCWTMGSCGLLPRGATLQIETIAFQTVVSNMTQPTYEDWQQFVAPANNCQFPWRAHPQVLVDIPWQENATSNLSAPYYNAMSLAICQCYIKFLAHQPAKSALPHQHQANPSPLWFQFSIVIFIQAYHSHFQFVFNAVFYEVCFFGALHTGEIGFQKFLLSF